MRASVYAQPSGLSRHANAPELAHVVLGLAQGSDGFFLPVVAVSRSNVHASTRGAGVASGGAVGVGDEAAGADGSHEVAGELARSSLLLSLRRPAPAKEWGKKVER